MPGPDVVDRLDESIESIDSIDKPAREATTREAIAEPAGASAEDAAPRAATAGGSEHQPSERRPSVLVAGVAVGLALALLVATLVLSLRPTMGDADRDAAVGSARTSLESLLSYSGASFDAHVAEVTPHLAPPFKDQFTKVAAADIKPLAVKNGATVQAKVYEAGVMDTAGDGGEGSTVRVLAFVNQATTTTAQKTPAIDQNRVIATMTKAGDRWLISDLAAF